MRLLTCLISFVGLIAIGCGSNPEARRATKSIATEVVTGFPKADPPAASDPASRDIATKIIAAHTGNDPSMLSKMKSMVFGREGKHIESESPFYGIAVKFKLSATWPDRGRYDWTSPMPFSLRLIDKQVFRDIANPNAMPPITEKQFDDLYGHLYADWLQLLVPLNEPDTILAPGPEFTQADVRHPSLRLWRTGKPQAILYYDPKTFQMTRLAYDGRENGIPTYFELALSDFKPTNGFLLAHRMYVRMNGRDNIEYERATLEFPKDHALKLFTDP